MDLTPRHLALSILHEVTGRVFNPAAVGVDDTGRPQTVTLEEHVELTVGALQLAVLAMAEAVDASQVGEPVTLDQVLARCSLRYLAT